MHAGHHHQQVVAGDCAQMHTCAGGELGLSPKLLADTDDHGSLMTRVGDDTADDGPTLRVSYQRHAYELGEHYNSVVPAKRGGASASGMANGADSDDDL
jgi:hypothetical protein